MEEIDVIVMHCSATKETEHYSFERLCEDHKIRGFNEPCGYHVYIERDGTTHLGRPFNIQGAHVKGNNRNSWGICYEGGLDENGNPKDTRTEKQKQAILRALLFLKGVSPNAKIKGHRDFSPDKDGDGIISPNEWIKSCPCFDVNTEYGGL